MKNIFPLHETRSEHADTIKHLLDVIQSISQAKDFEEVIFLVRKAARELTGADGATFVLREGDCCSYVDENAISPLWKGQKFPMKNCVSGWVMTHARPAVIEDIYEDPRVPIEAYRPTFVKSMLMVPIRQENSIGAIGNYWAAPHEPTPEEIEVLQTLANVTAVAIENVRLKNQIEEKAASSETTVAALNNFVWLAAHDLQSPLRAIGDIAGWIDESLSHKRYDDVKQHSELLKGRVQRMDKLLKSILQYAQVEYMADPYQDKIMMNGAALLGEALDIIEPPAEFQVEVNEKLKNISLPCLPLQEIFVNIIGYGVANHTKKEKPLITVDCEEREKEYVFTISDNGPGLDPAMRDKIFEIFHVLKSQNTQKTSGPGLPFVKKILESYGGSISVDSIPGRGTIFRFSWPKESPDV